MSVTAEGSPNRCIDLLQLSDACWLHRLSPARTPPPDRDESPVAHRQWRAQFLLGATGCSSRQQLTQIRNLLKLNLTMEEPYANCLTNRVEGSYSRHFLI